ncbi:MAG: hypothetical protein QOJ73_4366 [Streptosporangiaceae bacterium]|nr:hypothetical protein [Streptosporangiaceae bacterium]
MVRTPRRVTGEGTFTPWVFRHVVSWFRAFTTFAGSEDPALAALPLPLPGEELPQAASVSTRSMARPTAASRPVRRLFLVKGIPFLSLVRGPAPCGPPRCDSSAERR